MHPPPASYDRHGSCHFNRSPAVLEWCFVTLRPSSVVVAGSVGTGFRPSWFHLGRRRRHYHDDDDLSSLSSASSRDNMRPKWALYGYHLEIWVLYMGSMWTFWQDVALVALVY